MAIRRFKSWVTRAINRVSIRPNSFSSRARSIAWVSISLRLDFISAGFLKERQIIRADKSLMKRDRAHKAPTA